MRNSSFELALSRAPISNLNVAKGMAGVIKGAEQFSNNKEIEDRTFRRSADHLKGMSNIIKNYGKTKLV